MSITEILRWYLQKSEDLTQAGLASAIEITPQQLSTILKPDGGGRLSDKHIARLRGVDPRLWAWVSTVRLDEYRDELGFDQAETENDAEVLEMAYGLILEVQKDLEAGKSRIVSELGKLERRRDAATKKPRKRR